MLGIVAGRRNWVAESFMAEIAVVMACHNRCVATLCSLGSLYSQEFHGTLEVFLTDDGSTDGTREAVAAEFPLVNLVTGSGDLFWTGAMAAAISRVVASSMNFTYLLWLNDDVALEADAISRLVATAGLFGDRAIVVGAVSQPEGGAITYGAFVSVNRWRPLKLRLLEPSDAPQQAETMNGNVVLVPRIVAESLGNLDFRFPHNGADMDYAYRARRAGYAVVLAPGILGTCAANRGKHDWLDANLGLADRWRKVRSVKAFPVSGWFRFCRLYGGPFWPAVFCSPYLRCLLAGLRRRGVD